MDSVPFSKIRGLPPIFSDYIENFDAVSEFFNGDPHDDAAWSRQFKYCKSKSYFRSQLIKILLRQNGKASKRKFIRKQIQKLADPRSAAVVTGQQAGIFGGPLYTVYKALSTIRLAENLEQRYERPVVPIFWLEVDDHDFDEVRHFHLMLPAGEIRRFDYHDGEEEQAIPVKNRRISTGISAIWDELTPLFGNTENGKKTLAEIKKIYQPGESFVEVFIGFFRKYFPKAPIIFINPGDAELKQLAKPFYKLALEKHREIHQAIQSQTGILIQKQYDPQVTLRNKASHLFHVENNKRSRLEMSSMFSVHGKPKGDMENYRADFIENEVESLSPDVLLRPLLQDYLLPTVAYVGGPSEISYMAQLKTAYPVFGVSMPLIVPRWSGTVLEKKTVKFLKKFNFDVPRYIEMDSKNTLARLIENTSSKRIDAQFEKAYLQMKTRLNEIRRLGADLDATLAAMVDKSEQKMNYQLSKIQGRYQNAFITANKIATVRAKRAMNMILPEHKMQERTFSLLNYLLRYGKDFTKFLSKNITLETEEHHIIQY